MNSVLEAIRAKYPQYANIADDDLTLRIADKYPQYLDKSDFEQDVQRIKMPAEAATRSDVEAGRGESIPAGVNVKPVLEPGMDPDNLTTPAAAPEILAERNRRFNQRFGVGPKIAPVKQGVFEPSIPLPRIQSDTMPGLAATANTAIGVAESLESPGGLAATVLSMGSPWAARIIASAFGVKAVHDLPEAAKNAVRISLNPKANTQEKTEAWLGAGVTAAQAPLMLAAVHGAVEPIQEHFEGRRLEQELESAAKETALQATDPKYAQLKLAGAPQTAEALQAVVSAGGEEIKSAPTTKLTPATEAATKETLDRLAAEGKKAATPFNIGASDLAPASQPRLLHGTNLEQKNPHALRVAATPDGSVIVGKPGELHFNLELPLDSDLGFVTKDGTYLTREEASKLQGQPTPKAETEAQTQPGVGEAGTAGERKVPVAPDAPPTKEDDIRERLKLLRQERVEILQSVGGNLNNAAMNSQLGGLAPTKIRYANVVGEIKSLEESLRTLQGKPKVIVAPKTKGNSITQPKGQGLLLDVYKDNAKIGEIGRDNLGKLYVVRNGQIAGDGFRTVSEARDALLKSNDSPKPAEPVPAVAKAQGEVVPLPAAKASQEFDRLVKEHGQQLEWVTRPDDLFAEIGNGGDTASIEARKRQSKALQAARKNAARDLGINPDEMNTAVGRAKALDKLKAHIEEHKVKMADAAMDEGTHPAESADDDVSFLPDETATVEPPKLRPGEKKTGDLFQGDDQPFNLMGDKGTDVERVQREKDETAKRAEAAKVAQEKAQMALPGTEHTGLGAAVPGEFNGSNDFVSNMFAAIDRDRAAMGKDPMPETQRRSWDEDNQKALARMNRDPQWIPDLIAEVSKSPRPLLSWENAGMVWQRHLWKAEANNALSRIAQAFDDGRTADLESAKLDAARYEDKLQALDEAVGRNGTGSEAGRSLQAQKMAGGEDFTLVEMRLQARKSKGGAPLSEKESAEIKALHDKIAANEKAMAEQATRVAQLEMDKAAAEARARVAQGPSYAPGVLAQAERFATYMDKTGEAALARLKARLGRTSAGIDPTILSDAAIYGAAKLTRGLVESAKWADSMIADLGEWAREHIDEIRAASEKVLDGELAKVAKAQGAAMADKVKKAVTDIPGRIEAAKESIKGKAEKGPQALAGDVQKLFKAVVEQNPSMKARELADVMHGILKESMPEITWQETIDAISGRGKFWRPSQEALAKNVRDKKAQLRLIGHQMDVEARKPLPRTGYQPDKMTDTARQEAQRLEELKRRYGVVVTNPATQLASALSARKTYYTHRLADLKTEIASRTRIVKTSAKVSDPALEALKAEYEKVKAEHNSIFAKELSDESKLKAATSAAERNLAEWNAKLEKAKRGDFSRDPANPKLSTPGLETIRAKAEAARNEVEHLKDLDTAFQEQKQVKALEDSIAEYERRIKENDLATPEKPGVSSPKVEALNAKRTALAGQLADLRASTPEAKAAKIEAARKAVQESVDELSRQINEGDIAPEPKQPPKVTTPELEKMRAERDQLIKMKQKLQNAAKAKSPSEVEAKKIDDTQKQIDELARRINEGDIVARANASKPVSPALELLRGEREGLQKILAQLRNAAKPKKSPAEIAMQARKTAIAREIADLQERITKGDFSPKVKRTIVPDAQLSNLQTEKARLVKEFKQKLLTNELANRSRGRRVADLLLRIRREFILSGLSSIGKLFAYSAQEFALNPVKEAVGAALSKVPGISRIAERAPSEIAHRGFVSEVKNIVADNVAAFTKGIKDAKDTWQGESELKAKYDPAIRPDGEFKAFFGTLHQMEKSPLIRLGFERSFRRRMEHAADRGVDVTDPTVQQRIGVDAYQDALRGALINRNAVVNRVNRFITSLEEKSKVTGRTPVLATAAKFAFGSELPVQHVPANYVARTAEYIFGLGTGSAKAAMAFRRGIENLSPSEADQIMRHLKSGSVGSAAMLAGFLLPQLFGGLWTPGAKKSEKLKAGEIQAGPVKVRYWATHEQVLNAAQFGATVRKISETKNQGLSAGAQAALWGLADEVPYARELSDFAKAKDPRQTGKFWEEKAKGYLIPQGVSQAAELLDMNEQWRSIRRKPYGLGQTLETGIPGLRKNVPTQ